MRKQWSYRVRDLLVALAVIAIGAVLLDAKAPTRLSRPAVSKPPSVRMRNAYGSLPLSFEENRGQTDPLVKFLARGGGYALFLTSTEAVLKLRAPAPSLSSAKYPAVGKIVPAGFHPEQTKMSVVHIRLEGADAASQASGIEKLPGVSNYFIGKDPKKWRTNVPTFAGVKFAAIYPGIDLVYRGAQGRLEYDYIIAPKADPSRIRMDVDGADRLSIDRDGNLVIKTSGGEVVQKSPVIYQGANAAKHPVKGGYVLIGKNRVAFKLDSYDRSQPLTIDPLLSYTTYLGGSGNDYGLAIAVDSFGQAIVTGYTTSVDFPVVSGAFQSSYFGGFADAFVSKINPDGSALVYSTYAGGSGSDSATGIAVDPQGNAYVTGFTSSPDFPASIGAFQTAFSGPAGTTNAFVIGLDPGGGLIYSTFLNGSSSSVGNAIAVDPSGDAYVTGSTSSPDFPVTEGVYQPVFANSFNRTAGFVTAFNSTGTALKYSTFLLPPDSQTEIENQSGNAIGLDGSQNVYLAVSSPQNCCDSMVALDGSLSKLNFSTPIDLSGSSVFGTGISSSLTAIAVDSDGDARGVGVYSANQKFGEVRGPFVVSLNPTGNVLNYQLFQSPGGGFGYPTEVVPQGVAIGPMGDIFVVGTTPVPVPTTPGAFQTSFGGGASDAFLVEFDPTGSNIEYFSFLGGSAFDEGSAVAVDSLNNVYLAGSTGSNDFPVTGRVFQPGFAGGTSVGGAVPSDAFVARIAVPPLSPSATMTPSPTVTPVVSATATVTANPTPTRALLPTHVPTPTPSITPTATTTPTASPTATSTAIPTPVGTAMGTIVASPTPTPAATATPTASPTPMPIVALRIAPAEINFGRVKVGVTSAVRFVTVANPAKNKVSAMITGIELRSGGNGFAIDQARTTCGQTLAKGKSCRVAITFTPAGAGAYSDNLMVTGDFTNSGESVGLIGTAKCSNTPFLSVCD